MLVDAIILTGGRSARLDSVPKSEFVVDGSTLLERTLRAARVARRIVVVGQQPSAALPDGVMLVREEPPFGGPVAAIGAGLAALRSPSGETPVRDGDAVLILACDMPHIGDVTPTLVAALAAAPDADGVIAVDPDGHRQPLAAVYRTGALENALRTAAGTDSASALDRPSGQLAGLPMFRLLDRLTLVEIRVPSEATADLDTWEDAERLGATPPASRAVASSTDDSRAE